MKNSVNGQEKYSQELLLTRAISARNDAISSQESINAFSTIRSESEIEEDAHRLNGHAMDHKNRPLEGVPISVKDSFHVSGLPRWHGSASHPGHRSECDSVPVRKLKEAGAIIIGKTTMPDYGLLASGLSSEFGITRNPWNLALSPGGSSSGAAASVASTKVEHALGTDIAGSVRLPAAQCGITALKPTQGVIAHSPSSTWRSAGPMARSIKELRKLFNALIGSDRSDHLSVPSRALTSHSLLQDIQSFKGLRIGVMEWPGYGPMMSEETGKAFETVLAVAKDLMASLIPVAPQITLRDFDTLDRCLKTRATVELQSCPKDRQEKLLELIRTWSISALNASAGQYYEDFEHLSSVASRLSGEFGNFDLIISPTLGQPSFPAEDFGPDTSQPLLFHANYTAWFNQTGQPAVSLPMGISTDGIPLGLQIVGPPFSDLELLEIAGIFEKNLAINPDFPEL